MRRSFFLTVVLLTLVLSLTGCVQPDRTAECRASAETHIELLQKAAEGDSLTLEDAAPEIIDGVYCFRAGSSGYRSDFRISVGQDGTVTDDYYTLTLREEAETLVSGVLDGLLPERALTFETSLRAIRSAALSGRRFASLTELQESCGDQSLIQITVSDERDEMLSEEEIRALLRALKDADILCDAVMPGEYRTFEIRPDGVSYVTASGADGGSYIKRYAYPLEE